MPAPTAPSIVSGIAWLIFGLFLSPIFQGSSSSLIPGASAFVTGGIAGSMGVRLEIRDFIQNQDALNLYLVALDRMQSLDQNELQSYYQVAGIHGAPHISFDGVQSQSGDSSMGYCEHASVLFPTWHRPYLALYEEILYGFVSDFVGSFPPGSSARNRYERAAANWRMPFWDWARDASIPDIVGQQQSVVVELPTGFTTIANPLYSYQFNPITTEMVDALGNTDLGTNPETFRGPDGPSNILAQQGSLRNNIYNLLSFVNNYQQFSNKAWNQGTSGGGTSLESVHDTIHALMGGYMAYIDVAAFDPIFWLHHTNVDRLLALYQASFPNSYTRNQVTPWGTFFIQPRSVEGANTPLAPFRMSDSNFWNSNACRATNVFGYTYPELQDTSLMSSTRRQQTVRARINQLYGGQAPLNILGRLRNIAGSFRSTTVSSQAAPANGTVARRAVQATSGPTLPPNLLTDNSYNEWSCSVNVEKVSIPGSFVVHLFLGPITSGPASWARAANNVGSHGFFAMAPMPCSDPCQCEQMNPGMNSGAIVSGGLPLTSDLLDKIQNGELDNLDPECVLPYLQQNLSWKAVMVNGTVLDAANFPSLKVTVNSFSVKIPDCDQDLPETGDQMTYFNVDPAPCEGM